MRGDRLPFSHLLPIIDLALLVVLVFVPITMTAFHLYEVSTGSNQVHIRTHQFDMTAPRDQIVPIAIRAATMPRARTMMAINLPGVLLQALISIAARTSPPSSWHPQALALQTWQALVFPFFALPFWWLVGCGLDVLVYKVRLHWSLLFSGTLLFGLCLAAVIAFCFPMSLADRADLALPMTGFAGWTIAFGILPIAWIAQRIRQRREPQFQTASL
jgi:hypothetical protein